jgi:single-strand DNA-binding protein
MSGVNKVILLGRFGKDPEIRYTPSGTAVANFSIATSQQWKDKDTGEKKEKTEWHKIVAWRRQAELMGEFFSKGDQIYIEGRLETRSWEPDDGVKRYITEIIMESFAFVGSTGGTGTGGVSRREPDNDRDGNHVPNFVPGGGPADDDIPF